jgi:hypothetical protein
LRRASPYSSTESPIDSSFFWKIIGGDFNEN